MKTTSLEQCPEHLRKFLPSGTGRKLKAVSSKTYADILFLASCNFSPSTISKHLKDAPRPLVHSVTYGRQSAIKALQKESVCNRKIFCSLIEEILEQRK